MIRLAFGILIGGVLALTLWGCAAPVGEVCRGYGFAPGTVEFSNCAMQVSISRQQRLTSIANQQMQNQAVRDAAAYGRR